jgi:hypothetical protein
MAATAFVRDRLDHPRKGRQLLEQIRELPLIEFVTSSLAS